MIVERASPTVRPRGNARIDRDENPWDAAVRSDQETGLAVGHVAGVPSLVHVDVHAGPHGHTHLDLRYLLEGGDADPAPPPDESQEVAWFSWTEALAITEPCMVGILRHLSTAA